MYPSDEEEELIVIDHEEMAEFIQERLIRDGAIVTVEDILKVLSYQIDYFEEKGIAVYELEEEE